MKYKKNIIYKKLLNFNLRLIIFLLFAIWPVLVIKKDISVFSPDLSVLQSGTYQNYFTYYRLLFYLVITILLLLYAIPKIISQFKKLCHSPIIGLIICLLVWIVFASLLSPYPEAVTGLFDRSRGMIAYLVNFFFAVSIALLFRSKQKKNGLFFSIGICSFLVSLISLGQFLGYDPFFYFPLNLIFRPDQGVTVRNFISFGGLYNPNIMGGFQAVCITIFYIYYYKSKTILKSCLLYFLNCLIFLSIITSSTRGSWIATIIFLVLFHILDTKIQIRKTGRLLAGFIVIFILLNINKGMYYFNRTAETVLFSLLLILFVFLYLLIYKSFALKQKLKSFFFLFFFTIISIIFFISLLAPFLENRKIMSLATGRPYIYHKVCRLISRQPVFGTGPETLLYYLDVEDPYRYLYLKNEYIDKPHSIYFQLALEGGIPVLIFFLIIISNILAVLWNKKDLSIVAKAVFWGITVYLIQGLTTDANICSDPLFYSLVGLGMGYIR